MEKISIFYGPPETGKTKEAREIASQYEEHEVVWIFGRNVRPDNYNPFLFSDCTIDTKLIIIDDLLPSITNFEIFYSYYPNVTVNKKRQHSFEIQPRIIITTNSKPQNNGASFHGRFKVTEFK